MFLCECYKQLMKLCHERCHVLISFHFLFVFLKLIFCLTCFFFRRPQNLERGGSFVRAIDVNIKSRERKKMLINFAKFVFRNGFWEVVSSALVFSIKPSLSFTKYEHADCWNFKNKHQLPKWPVIFAFRNDFDDVVREKKMRLDMTLRETRSQQGNESR